MPEEAFNFYGKSKIVAERESWRFMKKIKFYGSKMELITLHPGGIIGPTLTKDTSFTSMEMIKRCFTGQYPRLPYISSSYTDVRDLALVHYNALTCQILLTSYLYNEENFDGISPQRYIVASEPYFAHEIGEWLAEDFKDSGYKPTTKSIPYFIGQYSALNDYFLLSLYKVIISTTVG